MCAAAGGSPPSPEHEPLPVPAVWPFPPPEYRMQHWWPGIQAIERSTEGSFGILIVDFRDSGPAAQLAGPQRVALRTSSSIRAEFMAARLASCLALVYPQWELLTRESDVFGACEWATLATYCLRFSARSVGYSAEEVAAATDVASLLHIAPLHSRPFERRHLQLMEFVDCRAGGAPGPECPGPGCPGPSGLPRAAYLLGRLLSFDLLVNNWDRLPVGGAWATHTGNPGNILWAPAGAAAGAACPASVLPVAIDFAIQPITSPAALAEYVDRVRAIMRMVLARYCAELAEDATSAAALGRLRATAGAWLRATCPADEAPPADPTNKAMGDVFWAARAELREHANMCASATGPNLDTDILNTHLARGLAQHALFSMVRLAPEIGLWQEARRSEAPPEGGQDAWVPWAEALLSACTLPDPGPGDLLDALRLPPVSLEAMLTEARVELGPPPGGVSTPGSPARGSADAAPSVPPALPPKAAHESGLLSRGATLTDGIETMRMVAGGGLFLALVDTARALAAGHAWRLESPPQ